MSAFLLEVFCFERPVLVFLFFLDVVFFLTILSVLISYYSTTKTVTKLSKPNIITQQPNIPNIVCIYGYRLICVDERYSKLYNTYCDEDTINKFLKDVIKESEYFSQAIETVFNKPLVMSETNHEDFNNSTKCWIYKQPYEKGEVKVKYPNHITRKY